MQTLQPTLRLGRDVWDRVNLPVAEFHARLAALRDALRERRLEAALLYGRGLDGCGHPTYFSNYTVKLPVAALLVVPLDAEPVLFFQGASRGLPAAKATTWIADVRACADVGASCVKLLAESSWPASRLGLAGVRRLMPHAERRRLLAAVEPAAVVEIDDVVDGQRAVKSSRELDQTRRAARVVGQVLAQVTTIDVADRHERSLEAAIVRAARLEGAEDVRVMMARPTGAGLMFRPPEDVDLPVGARLVIHLELARERYWSQAARTFEVQADRLVSVVEPPADAVVDRLVGELRPGRTAAGYAAAAADVLGAAAGALLRPYGFGHGIGITREEPPCLDASDATRLREGMCFALRSAWVDAVHGPIVRTDTLLVAGGRSMCLTADDR